ncbi:MAG TPA: Ig-like domain-containing domain [Bacteroidales bacterium]|nr:Ig-like domain-containing domain [Bacteroidales bacterium]
MTRKNYFRHSYSVILGLILISACAKISSPTGGPKDTRPPVVVKSEPVSGTRNYNGKKFVVTFDEFVELREINEKFMVSPPMQKKPEISIKGKSLVVKFDDDLRDSTTYTFYFQDAIRDLNEGNPIDNYSFVFSTGPVIDSLSVTGNVLKANDLNPPENTLVLLYSDLSDSAFIKKIPDYISKADKNGYFRIDNIKEGTYRLYALIDADNNKNFNLPDEELAFLDSLVIINPQKNYFPSEKDSLAFKSVKALSSDTVFLKGEYKLILFKPSAKKYYLTSSSRPQAYKLNFTLSLPPDTMDFSWSLPGLDKSSYLVERSRDKDTLIIWLRDSALYSQPVINSFIRYPFTDSTGKIIQKEDSSRLRFLSPRVSRATRKPEPYRVVSSVTSGKLTPGQRIAFVSQTPFRLPDTSKIRLYRLIEKEREKTPYSLTPDSESSCRMFLTAGFLQGANYLLINDSGSFGDIYGAKTDSTGIKFVIRENSTFGKLIVNIKNYQGKRIIQLLTSDEKLVREIKMDQDGKAEFPYLEKGMYRLKIIYDLNGDGKWTTGDFISGRQPEPVSFMPMEIEIKENWENELYWDVSEMHVKKFKNTAIRSRSR